MMTQKNPNPLILQMPKYRSDYNMLFGAIGYIGGKEAVVTHRNPENGELWCECSDWEEGGRWIDSSKIGFSKKQAV